MQKTIISIILFFAFSFQLLALDASVSFATFKSPSQNYVEVYLTMIGETLEYKKLDSINYQASVEVIFLFKQEEQIVKFDKFMLNSPLTERTLNFIDQKRYALEDGNYSFEVSLRDMVDTTNVQNYKTPLKVDFAKEGVQQSDIQLLASYDKNDDNTNPFVKNGYYMVALPFNFCDKNTSVINFYNEIYNTDKILKDDFLISYSIEEVSGMGETKKVMVGHKRRKPQPISVILMQMDISQLPSGNYKLVVEVRDRNKKEISRKAVAFQRSNPFLDKDPLDTEGFDINTTFTARLSADELRYSLKAIAPLITDNEGEILNLVIKDRNINAQRNYLFTYWARRNSNNPEVAYNAYMEVARAVDKKYNSGFGYGFESDRGNIFMKYGKPHDVLTIENELDAPPYEIWAYNRIDKLNQSNVKFIFYNPTLAAGGYTLLHSNARGEMNNPQWQIELYRDAPEAIEGKNYHDGTQIQDGITRMAARHFNDM